NNDGAVIRVPASSGRPSGGYLSPCGLENVSFCSASTESSNTQKSGTQSGTQSGYRSNSKNECSKTESKMQAKEDVTPEKRRRLEEKQECCDCVTAAEGRQEAAALAACLCACGVSPRPRNCSRSSNTETMADSQVTKNAATTVCAFLFPRSRKGYCCLRG
ncbi:unnamed protein product, partial [Notodromas monacha]